MLIPLGITISLTGIAGVTTGGTALQRELWEETTRAIKETAFALTQIQEQLNSLVDVVLQN